MNLAVVNSLKQSQLGNSQDEAYTPKRKREALDDIACTHLLNHGREILDGLFLLCNNFSAHFECYCLVFFLYFHIHRDVKEINFSSGEERKKDVNATIL